MSAEATMEVEMKRMIIVLLIGMWFSLSGCIRFVHEITPEFQSGGTVNINIRTDSDDPNVNVTVDDVQMDWKELKSLIEQKMKSQSKKKS
jgi:capsular polysaccharide biosynthesis protein